ncbi:MAG: hypothetical protein J6A65_05595, partial [Pseudomonas sp.]|nr:hypothetical protein [Pseudomonas sp.]
YEVISGNWPKEYNEVVLVVNSNNQISKMTLYMLGLRDFVAAAAGCVRLRSDRKSAPLGDTDTPRGMVYGGYATGRSLVPTAAATVRPTPC